MMMTKMMMVVVMMEKAGIGGVWALLFMGLDWVGLGLVGFRVYWGGVCRLCSFIHSFIRDAVVECGVV